MPKRLDSVDSDELSPKKRKKVPSSPVAATKPTVVSAPLSSAVTVPAKVMDPYEAAIAFEEREAMTRNTKQDMKLFHETCNTLRRLMEQIKELKKTPEKNRGKIAELRALASLHVVALKKINRLEKIRLRSAREKTHEAKQRVDSFHLTLQNLLYEIVHIRREVNRCLEFRSQDESIDLVTLEEFYKDAPSDISKPEETRDDEHRQHLARLDWELEQRKRLAQQCRELNKEKASISREIDGQRRRLQDLAPQLNKILEATKPLQVELGLPLDRQREQHRLAHLLPKPLYVLYVQSSAYAEVSDTSLSVTVCGNEEEAVSLRQAEQREVQEESDSDPEQEEEVHRKKRHRKTNREEEETRLKKALQKHPLMVVLELACQDVGTLVMEFTYLIQLGIVTVTTAVHNCVSTGELVSADSLLDHLSPGDSGADSPSPSTAYQLRRAGLGPFPQYVSAGKVGRPYQWAQRLAGLDFIAPAQAGPVVASDAVSFQHLESVLQQITNRLKSRVALQQQLNSLASGTMPLPEDLRAQYPDRLGSRLVGWQPITWETYQAAPPTAELVAEQVVDSTATFYLAKIERQTARLLCYVAVSAQHPQVAPVFSLLLEAGQQQVTARSPVVRVLECDLNVDTVERLSTERRVHVLAVQLQTALCRLDVVTETEDRCQVAREKLMLRPHRGRDRIPPFFYVPSMKLFSHQPQ